MFSLLQARGLAQHVLALEPWKIIDIQFLGYNSGEPIRCQEPNP